eukprot:CAMPEP_0182915600 /NCGR_PEP_ID=MMETSP0105_2-20130417/418_1 /TAXON_ID=81532 ORGANISM="Acanthoeca-like sp., Strain 10tr" /NCGR_SAMPLE_ID=MMETSP0105_2 /ASSEMBLY_ACC=CAM_ASM_000205 /LENGTH=276 /DNA_ID=CAMNT_0025052473 /DNA_START=20 /DNA_END=847 /DNA_ORIENTATION=-
MTDQQLECALDLMRRMPPKKFEPHLAGLINTVPLLCEDLLACVDQPLQVQEDATKQKYLLCDYNRDGDSYRSPHTNTYEPAIEDREPSLPSPNLRKLEEAANIAFDRYRELYFDGGVSSVYLWDLERERDFAGCVLIKKEGDSMEAGYGESKRIVKGCYDSVHVFEVETLHNGRNYSYKLTSTVQLWLETSRGDSGVMELGGSLTYQDMTTANYHDKKPNHIAEIGTLIEKSENHMRNTLNHIYFGKTKDIVNDLRSVEKLSEQKEREVVAKEISH